MQRSTILATGLLATSAFLIFRPSDSGHGRDENSNPETKISRNELAVPKLKKPATPPRLCAASDKTTIARESIAVPESHGSGKQPVIPDLTTRIQTSEKEPPTRKVGFAPRAQQQPASEIEQRVTSVQLAEDFRLPAALMPQENQNEKATSVVAPAVADAVREMTGDFYRKVALIPPGTDGAATTPPPKDEVSDDLPNVIVENNPQTGQIRELSDQLYRSLFGDEAFNRQTLKSAVEVGLPSGPTVNGTGSKW